MSRVGGAKKSVRDSSMRCASSVAIRRMRNLLEIARLSVVKGCQFVCCDDCSTKRELLDVILRVPYVDKVLGVTKPHPATLAAISVRRARLRVRATV